MEEIVLATGNAGKVDEMAHLLEKLDIRVHAQSEFAVPSVKETGLTFVENAILKARNAAAASGLPAVADDSGLEVDALQGRPGIYSARFAGEGASDQANNERLLDRLRGLDDEARTARYQCVIVMLEHERDPTPIICQGTWEGRILSRPRGKGGFGYDPLFFVPTHECSAAELAPEEKNRISHRGQAMYCLRRQLEGRG